MANGRSKQPGPDEEGGGEGTANQQDRLRSFLVGLATDPARLGAFIQNPESEMETAGIEEPDRDILRSGNAAAIHGRITGQSAQSQPPMIILIIDAEQAKAGDAPALSVRSNFPPMIFGAQAVTYPPMIFAQQGGFPMMYPPIIPLMVFAGAEQGGGGEAAAARLLMPQLPQFTPLQLFPQIQPQLVVHPQIFPQVHPQITPLQVFPQIQPQLVHPQIFPQVHPQITPLQVFPQVHPQIFPQIFPQVHPQLVFPQVHPQFTPLQLTPLQLTPLQLTPLQLTPLQLTPLQLVSPQLVSPTLR